MTGADGHCHVQKPASQRSGDRNRKEMERERERERDLVYIRVDTVRLHPTNRLAHECTKIPATGKPGKSQSAAQPQKRKTPRCWHPGMELMELGDTQAARCQMSGSGFRFRMLV